MKERFLKKKPFFYCVFKKSNEMESKKQETDFPALHPPFLVTVSVLVIPKVPLYL
jgi:hypothetical protein